MYPRTSVQPELTVNLQLTFKTTIVALIALGRDPDSYPGGILAIPKLESGFEKYKNDINGASSPFLPKSFKNIGI